MPRISSVKQSAERIKNESVKNLYLNCLKQLEGFRVELQPRANDAISGFYKGKRVLRIYPKNQFFAVRVKIDDAYSTGRIRIKRSEDWENFSKEHLRPRLDEMDKKGN